MTLDTVYRATPVIATNTPPTKSGVSVSPMRNKLATVAMMEVTLLTMLVVKAEVLTEHIN